MRKCLNLNGDVQIIKGFGRKNTIPKYMFTVEADYFFLMGSVITGYTVSALIESFVDCIAGSGGAVPRTPPSPPMGCCPRPLLTLVTQHVDRQYNSAAQHTQYQHQQSQVLSKVNVEYSIITMLSLQHQVSEISCYCSAFYLQ